MTTSLSSDPMMLFCVDVKGYGAGALDDHGDVQARLLRFLDDAAVAAGLDRSSWVRQAKGDEELAAIPMPGNGLRVVDPFLRHLGAAVARLNQTRREDLPIRLRAAVHQGRVREAVNGWTGEAVLTVSRLVSSAPLRQALDAESQSCLAVLLSRTLYREAVAGGLTSFRPTEFTRVVVREKEFVDEAWLWAYPGTGQVEVQQVTAGEHAGTSEPSEPEAAIYPPAGSVRQSASAKDRSTIVQSGRDAHVIKGNRNTVTHNNIESVNVEGNATFGVNHGR